MIGVDVIWRVVLLFFSIALVVGFIIGFAYATVYASRALWSAFDTLFHDQAKWMLKRFSFLKPWRFFTVPVVAILIAVCLLLTFILILLGANSAEGEPLARFLLVI